MFIVDNCSIHTLKDNVCIQEELFENHGIFMTTLLHYHPDFNPTKLVFQTLFQRLSVDQAHYKSLYTDIFLNTIEIEMNNFDLQNFISFYTKCGYAY